VVKVDEYLERMTISYAKLARIHGSLRQATDIDLWTKTTNEKKKKEKNNGIYEDVDDDADGPPPPPAVGFYDDNDNKGSNCKNCKLVSTLNDKEKLQNKRKEKEEKEEEEEEEEGVRIVSVSIIETWIAAVLQMYRRELSLRATILDDITNPHGAHSTRYIYEVFTSSSSRKSTDVVCDKDKEMDMLHIIIVASTISSSSLSLYLLLASNGGRSATTLSE